jgi:hypothetical protein
MNALPKSATADDVWPRRESRIDKTQSKIVTSGTYGGAPYPSTPPRDAGGLADQRVDRRCLAPVNALFFEHDCYALDLWWQGRAAKRAVSNDFGK